MNRPSPDAMELLKLQVLEVYKRKLAGEWVEDAATGELVQQLGNTPFDGLAVVRYESDVAPIDVPGIHEMPREQIKEALRRVQSDGKSEVLLIYGAPGVGKSHLIAWFDQPEGRPKDVIVLRRPNTWSFEHFDSTLVDWLLETLLEPQDGNQRSLLEEKLRFFGYSLMQRLDGERTLEQIVSSRTLPDRAREVLGRRPTFRQLRERHDDSCFGRLDFKAFANTFANTVVVGENRFRKNAAKALLWYLLPEHREQVIQWMRGRLDPSAAVGVPFSADPVRTREQRLELVRILVGLFVADATQRILPSGAPKAPTSQRRVFLLTLDQLETQKALATDESAWSNLFAQLATLYNDLPNLCVVLSMPTTLRTELYHRLERQFQDRVRDFELAEVAPEATARLYRRRVQHWLGDEAPEIQQKLDAIGKPYLPFESRYDLLAAAQTDEQVGPRGVRDMLVALRRRFRARLDEVRLGPGYDYLAHKQRQWDSRDDSRFFEDHHQVLERLLPAISADVLGPRFGVVCEAVAAPSGETVPNLTKIARLKLTSAQSGAESRILYVVRLTSHVSKPLRESLALADSLDPQRFVVCVTRNGHLKPSTVKRAWPKHSVAAPDAEQDHCALWGLQHIVDQRSSYLAATAPAEAEKDFVDTIERVLRGTYIGRVLVKLAAELEAVR